MIPYPKIKRIDSDEVEDMFPCEGAIVSEKLDGCNLQIYKKDEKVHIAKRNTGLPFSSKFCTKGQYSEFARWVKGSSWNFLKEGIVLYGEGLKGNRFGDHYRKIGKIDYEIKEPFVLFDIFNTRSNSWISPKSKEWKKIVDSFEKENKKRLPVVPFIDLNASIDSYDEAMKYLGPSDWSEGVEKEGIVLKKYNPDGTAKMAKLVSKEFREVIKHKKSPKGSDYEGIALSVITPARVEKVMRKEGITDITGMDKLIKRVVDDVFEEEEKYLKELSWKIFKKRIRKIMPILVREEFEKIKFPQ